MPSQAIGLTEYNLYHLREICLQTLERESRRGCDSRVGDGIFRVLFTLVSWWRILGQLKGAGSLNVC